ncbi:MAG TPA: uroporphyrinogen decarboxylase family protein [Ruminiclostridium sp.]
MKNFIPDYTNIEKSARNIEVQRIPLYEHLISEKVMEKILNKEFADLRQGEIRDKREFFKNYNGFFQTMGYDTVSFEACIGGIMPGNGALGRHMPGVIAERSDFKKYPWEELPKLFFDAFSDDFTMLGEEMPQGMMAIGGPGCGVFENVQDIVGFENLCYIAADDPELYNDLFTAVGDAMFKIWKEFLERFGHMFTVCRFGDDLGFKTSTLLRPDDIRGKLIPQYKRIIDLVHSYNKPFLLHSCGKIFEVMDDLINVVKIDAKHSNEDQIAPFKFWVDTYGNKIGNFGGADVDVLCAKSEKEIKEYVKGIIKSTRGHGGVAYGSGNSIPSYVPTEGYIAMIEAVREYRGE